MTVLALNKRWRGLVGALVATGTVAGIAVAAPSAHAAFPGANGPIVFPSGGEIFEAVPPAFSTVQITNTGGRAQADRTPQL